MKDPQRSECERLIAALLAGKITARELRSLDNLLQSSSEARLQYLECVDSEAILHCWAATEEEVTGACQSPTITRSSTASPFLALLGGMVCFARRPVVAATLVAALIVPLGLAMLGVNPMPGWMTRDVVVTPDVPTVEKAVAQVIGMTEDCLWQEGATVWSDRSQLKSGESLRVATGLARVEFENGANVLLEGPAVFSVVSSNEGSLERGRLTARVPGRAKGFAIKTPVGSVVDQGTEFGLSVVSGKMLVSVFEGQVEIDSSMSEPEDDKEAASVTKKLLTVGQTAQVRSPGGVVEMVADNNTQFVRRLPGEVESDLLSISPEYVAAVKAAKPISYWRFESDKDGAVPNEMGERYPLRVEGKITFELSGSGNRVASFGSNVLGRYRIERHLVSEEPIKRFLPGDYTLELWVKPDESPDLMTIAFLKAHGPGARFRSVTGMSYHAGSFRFVHKSIANKEVDLYSPKTFLADRWYHLVAVKRGQETELFVNAQLVAQGTQEPQAERDRQIMLGILPVLGRKGLELRAERYLLGQLDEVAIYDRPLSPEQVRSHYEMAHSEKIPQERLHGSSVNSSKLRP